MQCESEHNEAMSGDWLEYNNQFNVTLKNH